MVVMWTSTAVFMMNFKIKKMKSLLPAIAGVVMLCCVSCIESSNTIGGDLIPLHQRYDFYTVEIPLEEIYMNMADSLSGYSSTRITVGSVRDAEYGLSRRVAAFTLVPMFIDSIDFGKNPQFESFHFAAARDTSSFAIDDQERIFQIFNVYELSKPIDETVNFDCNKAIDHNSEKINKGTILYSGGDSLSFNFTEEFGKRFLSITQDDLNDMDKFLEKFPGIYIETEDPTAEGGRINIFDLQLSYTEQSTGSSYIDGNYAKLAFSAEFDGERRDTTLLFYYGATDFYDIDSLFTYSSTGSFPQYGLNLTSHETRSLAGKTEDKILVEGGGGLKPRIEASYIKKLAEEAITSKGGNPKTTVINKATIILPFEFPDNYTEMTYWPQVLSPTCRVLSDDSTPSFVGLSDTSSSTENYGEVNRSTLVYEPDITYHVQSLVRLDETDSDKMKLLQNGSYDVWFLIMANETVTSTTSGSDELSEYYSYLAYQSYYNDIYGGYSSGYSNYYSNYYNYALLAAYASSSTTTESTSVLLDKDRYYNAELNGPSHSSGRTPVMRITFAVPEEE